MTISRARGWLIIIFLAAFVIHCVCGGIVWARKLIYDEEFLKFIKQIATLYLVQLGVIFGGIFAQSTGMTGSVSRLPFRVAIAASVLWNVLILWRSAYFMFSSSDSVDSAVGYIGNVGEFTAPLIAGALAYYFTRKENQSNSPPANAKNAT